MTAEIDFNVDIHIYQFVFIIFSRSSSRSPSPDRSSPEVERSRNGRSTSPHDHQQKSEVTSQQETTKGETRKWKIRKQISNVEADAADSGAPRKRRWGTSQLLPTKKPALVISTDSLKVIFSAVMYFSGQILIQLLFKLDFSAGR